MATHRYALPETERFVQVPWTLMEPQDGQWPISAYTIAVYAAIRSFADFGRDTGARVSDVTIAKRARCSQRQVRIERGILQRLGYLAWKQDAKGGANLYTISLDPRHSVPDPRHMVPDPPAQGADNLEPIPRASTYTRGATQRETWMTPYWDWWKLNMKGNPPAGQIARHLHALDQELGSETVLRRLTNFRIASGPQYFSLARFAETHGSWDQASRGDRRSIEALPGESPDEYLARMANLNR